jgi:hypothetical protein
MGLSFLLGHMQPDPEEGNAVILYKEFEYVGTRDFPHAVQLLTSLPDDVLSELSTYTSGMNYDVGNEAAFISRTDYPMDAQAEAEFVAAVKAKGMEYGLLERTDEHYSNPEWLWTDGTSLHRVRDVPPTASTDKYDPLDYLRTLVQMRKAAGMPMEPFLSDYIREKITQDPVRVRRLASMLGKVEVPPPGGLRPPSMRRMIDTVRKPDE